MACLFEKVDFDLWVALKSETAAKIEYPFIAEKFKSEISNPGEA